jgi:tetratricopeptide (TPR) repeat protein
MPEKDISQVLAKARDFFEKAKEGAKRGDFDYAVDMYLEGLHWVPDAVQEGHIKLRELALERERKGWPRPSAAEAAEQLGGETALEQMLGAEYLLAKNPGHLPYAEVILKAAVAGGYKETAKWIADLMFLANNKAKKPSLQIYLLLKDSYATIGQIDRAVAACRSAIRLKPGDSALVSEFKNLLSRQAAEGGKVDEGDVIKVEDRYLAAVEETEEVNEFEGIPKGDDGQLSAKAKAFFEVAIKSAEVDNFDYAIDMYLEGLRYAPDALAEGHIPLCEMALRRQGKGGRKPSMMERVKRRGGKTALEQMLNAEYLFAKKPDHLPYAEAMLKAAVAGGYKKTAGWIANFVFQANNAAPKPSVQTYVLLKESYEALGELDKAVAASQRALRLKPEDKDLVDEYQRLSAELTVSSGKYDQEGDFRHSIKDRESQEKLQAQESTIKTEDYRISAVEEAREAMAQDPNLPKNIFNLAEALSDLRNDKAENEAMKLLEDAYKRARDFSYKQRAGQLKIKHLKRKIKEAEKGGDAQAETKAAELSAQLNETELEHYRLCVENYPTDLRAKYEYGVRLIRYKKYDEAIPLFQEAQRDPRHKISAMGKIGFCFFMKGWFTDAIDVFTRAIEAYEIKDDSIAKELRYNLARSYQEQGNTEKALEIYRKIAQLDFAYKDIRQQIDKLRDKKTKPTSQ